jgi:hypothetical protein
MCAIRRQRIFRARSRRGMAIIPRVMRRRDVLLRASAAWLIAALALAEGRLAAAQPRPRRRAPAPAAPAPSASAALPPSAPAAPAPSPDDARKLEAREHFDKAIGLFNQSAWDAALAEFLRSRQLFPTRNATSNAAICLRRLQRFDEALDMYEALLREFSDLPADLKIEAQRAVKELRGLVGTIDVQGAEPDAAISIDGLARGEYPALTPLRVPAGSHTVRVYKEEFEPFETRVEVAGGQTAPAVARLRALAAAGRLRVTESSGKALSVIVDGNRVGATPWEGRLVPGSHTVVLRGEGTLGTQPASVRVRRDELTSLSLAAEEVPASLRIEPSPAGASVSIDSVTVGHGIWQGRLRAGAHDIAIAAEGFTPETRQIRLARDERKVLAVELPRDPSSSLWRKPSRFTVELTGAVPLAPTFGGDMLRDCTGACSHGIGVGGYGVFRGGYELGSGFGFGVTAGYLLVQQSTTGRATELKPTGLAVNPGTVDDRLTLRGFVAGAFAGVSIGERTRFHLRLGAGALIGSVGDRRSGTFETGGGSKYDIGPIGVAPFATFLYVDPEIRLGFRVSSHLELSLGALGLILVDLSRPTWDASRPIFAAADGAGTFAPERLTGSIVVLITPGVGIRYDF